jgi:hypothetical protein
MVRYPGHAATAQPGQPVCTPFIAFYGERVSSAYIWKRRKTSCVSPSHDTPKKGEAFERPRASVNRLDMSRIDV